jgi:hypothetical protein
MTSQGLRSAIHGSRHKKGPGHKKAPDHAGAFEWLKFSVRSVIADQYLATTGPVQLKR